MDTKASQKKNTYHIVVKEILDDHITEWAGDLTLIPQENGETYLDISFTDQPALIGLRDKLWNDAVTIFSLNY